MSNAEKFLEIIVAEMNSSTLADTFVEARIEEYARLKSQEENKELVEALRELTKRIDVDSDDLYDLSIRQLITKHTNNDPQ